jgi:glycosyltransferase involved in cell wall biosynthesis
MEKNNVFVIIPAFNEEKHLPEVILKAKRYLKNIVVVDDGSRDQTAKMAKAAGAAVLTHSQNLGKAAALKTGADFAFASGAKAVIFMDGDGQHNPEEIPLFLKKLERESGPKVVFGVRWLDAAMPLGRFLINKLSSVTINLMFGAYIPDIPCGYKALTKKAYDLLDWQPSQNHDQGYGIETEIAAKVGLLRIPYAFVPVETIYFDKGRQSRAMPLRAVIKIAFRVLVWRLTHPSKW